MSLAVPQSPGRRSRSVSQPLREGIETTDFFHYAASLEKPPRLGYGRSISAQNINSSDTYGRRGSTNHISEPQPKGRARSGSLVAVTEVGGDEPDSINDRVGVGANNNAAWVNSPGAWVIHPVLIISAKILIDAIPHMTQDLCWTIVNLGYMAVSTVGIWAQWPACARARPRSSVYIADQQLSFLVFHHHTGVPFENA